MLMADGIYTTLISNMPQAAHHNLNIIFLHTVSDLSDE